MRQNFRYAAVRIKENKKLPKNFFSQLSKSADDKLLTAQII